MMLSSLRLAENLIKLGFKAEGELETVSDRLRRLWEPRFNRNQKTCNIQESQE